MTAYNLKSLNLPKLTGAGLKAFAAAVENPLGRALLVGSLLENGGIPRLREINLAEVPTFYPLISPDGSQDDTAEPFVSDQQPLKDFPYRIIRDYTDAYINKTITPLEIAEKVMAAIQASEQGDFPLRAFIAQDKDDLLAQAHASSDRYRQNKPLGPLDGVPIAIKDEIDMLPYPTTVGTCFLGKTPPVSDSTVAARLRSAGALLVGKTNMHEIGINPNGANANYGAVRNPFNDQCDTGGSSSGSAAAVAAGLVPVAIGADGGGSIRIPASLCGLVGLKPTFGRISENGAAPLCWSVAHLGPLATCVEDTAHIYSLMAGPDPADTNTLVQPPVTLAGWNQPDLKGVRLGIYPQWFEHAAPEVVKVCYAMVEQLKQAGASVHSITIPELDEIRIAHVITILSEMAICMKKYSEYRKQQGSAVRLSLVLGEIFTALDYLQAQRMRTRALGFFREIYRQVDVILSPATALAAQPIPAGGARDGWSDLGTDTELMRFVYAGNLTGLPAISFPAGYDERGLPVGMQAMSRHWEENLLLRVAFNAEQTLQRRKPQRFYPIF